MVSLIFIKEFQPLFLPKLSKECWEFQRFIYFGKSGEIATNNLEDQEISALALHLLQVSLVYINTLMIQQVLREPGWMNRMTERDMRALSPLPHSHFSPYGVFDLDMEHRIPLDEMPLAA